MKIIVLGSGMIGRYIASDLSKEKKYDVTIVDINKDALLQIEKVHETAIKVIESDINKKNNLNSVLKNADIAVNAVPGSIGFHVLRGIIDSGTDVVDIAFYGEDPFELDGLAKEKGVTAVVDCGIAPGVSNILTGYMDSEMDRLEYISIYVGGLPKERKLPFEYKAVFSPSDVIEEYTRPVRLIENGKVVIKQPLTEPEFLYFENIGTLEAFNSDGLRTLIRTIKADNMKEKTLRYPGHREKMKLFFDTGLFSRDKVDINGSPISPIDLTSKLLFDHWRFLKQDRDFTVLRVIITGTKNNKRLRYTFDLYDEFDEKNGVHSMARTTGYTASMAVRLIETKGFERKGVSPPEYIGKVKGAKEFIMKGLSERNINFTEKIEDISNVPMNK